MRACAQEGPYELEQVADAFSFPVDLQHPGDGSTRLFVVEKRGTIRIFDLEGQTVASQSFLDIESQVQSSCGECGLLGLAFHPDYAQNGFFFVNYTAPNPLRTRIVRFQADPNDPGRALADSETLLLEVEQPYSNHNAGQLAFGADGYLYVGLGDGGAGGDPQDKGQDRATLLGSLLRIDVDATSGALPYGIPDDNPFVGNTDGYLPEIYAWGFRNPWRFAFDVDTGRLWLADVGQNAYEEIDIVEKGLNYGWDVVEGLHCFEPSSNCDQTGLTPPVWEYSHALGRSITGGYVYRGARVPDLIGKYIYADYGSGRIWALTYEGPGAVENVELANTNLNITTFGQDAERELYLATAGGEIYRFAKTSTTSNEEQEVPGMGYRLGRNYPNPFRERTVIAYTLDRSAQIELAVYDELGRRVRTLVPRSARAPGAYTVTWDGRGEVGKRLSGGVYFCRLASSDGPVVTRRVILVP
jgi:glucose/arabinose dehydrogenase